MMKWIKKHKLKLLFAAAFGMFWWFSLPEKLFDDSYSTVVYSNDNQLIGAKIADDEQWRFPEIDTVPNKFKSCILQFEDEYFYSHPGFNPISISKAFYHNLKYDTRYGGSTITQQVIRLPRKNQERTYAEKFLELIKATRLEVKHSKDQILKLYATYAPFGGNVVGLSAASWRYYGISPNNLSWGQAAALAVLPNAPAMIYPGKNDLIFKQKRNDLLKKLYQNDIIDESTYKLALLEKLPGDPENLPQHAPHLTDHLRKKLPGCHKIKSTIDFELQRQVNQKVANHHQKWKQNLIHNAAVLVINIESNNVIAYTGNTKTTIRNDKYVDLVQSKRSTGSLLKPFLYASLIDNGELMPHQLIADVPTLIHNYQPQNFDKSFNGAVHADDFLKRSLNVPAVRLLKEYGLQRFYNRLKDLNIKGIKQPADYYGLPLILGGAESSLWHLTSAYANMASSLRKYNKTGYYYNNQYNEPHLLANGKPFESNINQKIIGAGAIYKTLNALKELKRPGKETFWETFADSKKIAWKTGTSYGFKDAWAIGVSKKYAVGVWSGNASGTGRPNLTGVSVAAPLMFEVFDVLPKNNSWFQKPFSDLTSVKTCSVSGWMAGLNCPTTKHEMIPKRSIQVKQCPYHKIVNLSANGNYQVRQECASNENIITQSWFALPPIMAHYYKKHNPNYKELPPFLSQCQSDFNNNVAILYPKENQQIIIPKKLDQKKSKIVFEATTGGNTRLYWYLNKTFIKQTNHFHKMAENLTPGNYKITVIDEFGNQADKRFIVKRN